ncbi:MAG: efflux RND transporter permease subunit [Candidatus Xenobia bacterium]
MHKGALGNPYAVVVMALIVIIIGVTSLQRMPVDILPTFKTPAVEILTTYSGMPTEMVEHDITNRLERWTSQAIGVVDQESRSLIGVSVLKNFFQDGSDPNGALTQCSALALSDLHNLPPGTLPPIVMLFDPTASQPLCLLSISSDQLDQTQLYDIGYYQIRNLLAGVPGVVAPAVYGGKVRQILVYVNKDKLQARGLSPMDVVNALAGNNIMIPTGDARIGDYDYAIVTNAMVDKVSDLNDIPIKWVDNKPVYVRDIGVAKDAAALQTNIVRVDGKHAVYIPVYRQPGANTIQVVEGVKKAIPQIQASVTHGDELKMTVLMDQSVYVRKAITGLLQEGLMGFVLAALAIYLFLNNAKSTVIVAVTLPLSVLPAFILLYFTGQSINVMTLGGLSLAVGMIIDNAVIVLENIARHMEEGAPPGKAALNGAGEIATAVMVATIVLCIVFFPVSLMEGMAKFLFTPLAMAVVFSLTASYVMALTVVPAACAYFLKGHEHHSDKKQSFLAYLLSAKWFSQGYDGFEAAYRATLRLAMKHRILSIIGITAICGLMCAVAPFLGNELFPPVDSGQFTVLMRCPSGFRPSRTEMEVSKAEACIRTVIPKSDLRMVVSNIGLPGSLLAAYTPNAGPQDAFLLVQLQERHGKDGEEYANDLRQALPLACPGDTFSFDCSGLIESALNFGRLAPIDVQVTGPHRLVAMQIAKVVQQYMLKVPGAVDVQIQQRFDYPELNVTVNRTRAAAVGLNTDEVVKNVVTALNSSTNFVLNFWDDNVTGNNYFIGAMYPQKDINSRESLADIPITSPLQKDPIPLRNLATINTEDTAVEADHVQVRPVVDIYAHVYHRDVGGVANQVEKIIDRVQLPSGYHIQQLGDRAAMQQAFGSLGFGLTLAVILVYLSMVVLFKSFVDPLIVMLSVPPAFAGVLFTLWITHTTLNVQSLLGTIMVIGLTVSSSVLMVDFANLRLKQGADPYTAAIEASGVRLRPILMTAIAAIMGLIPTAIKAGEANTPLARAVIGGLLVSTVFKMYLLPILYSYWKKPIDPAPSEEEVHAH